MTYPAVMPGAADPPGYPVDNRDAVIGPLPMAAPPVLGDCDADPG
ncbi:hypothetical protein [Mycobacterium sp.]